MPASTLADGVKVGVTSNATADCLIRTVGSRNAATCAPPSAVSEGAVIVITDECGTSGDGRMEITGLAPPNANGVRLTQSDGPAFDASVTNGAFHFDGRNPAPGASYPTGVEWTYDGSPVGTAALPVKDDQFCLPVPN